MNFEKNRNELLLLLEKVEALTVDALQLHGSNGVTTTTVGSKTATENFVYNGSTSVTTSTDGSKISAKAQSKVDKESLTVTNSMASLFSTSFVDVCEDSVSAGTTIGNSSAVTVNDGNSLNRTISDTKSSIFAVKAAENQFKKDLQQLQVLKARMMSNKTTLLTTGDLNSGKSTFCNSLLKSRVVEENNEPCKAMFVEIVNSDLNQIHLHRNTVGITSKDSCDGRETNVPKSEYSGLESRYENSHYSWDDSNKEILDISKLQEIYSTEDPSIHHLKVFIKNSNPILNNSLFETSLIDTPGLNINTFKTTALLSKQREIDVIIFVVNAENHFTLSAREFLMQASEEKQYVFVVVNKFDLIRKQESNKNEILNQLKQISPLTWEHRDNLVHFVSAKKAFDDGSSVDDKNYEWRQGFEKLENALCDFVLKKRIVSKLAPAKQYLLNVLERISWVCLNELHLVQLEWKTIADSIHSNQPRLDGLKSFKQEYLDNMDDLVQDFGANIYQNTKARLETFVDEFLYFSESVEWYGCLHAYDYSKNLQRLVVRLASTRLQDCCDDAKLSYMTILQQLRQGQLQIGNFKELEVDYDISISRIESVPLEIEERMVFNSTDKYEFLADYVPSLACMSLGMLGFGFINSSFWKVSRGFERNGKLVFAGTILGGIIR